MYKPFHVFLPKALFSRACDHDIGLPSPKLPGSSPFPVQGEPLPVLPALPRVKSPSELPPWAPIPGIRQCTWSKCPPQAQGPPFLEIVLAWSSLPQGRDHAQGSPYFSLSNKTPVRYLFIPVLLFQAWKTYRVQDPILRYKEGWWIASQEISLKIRSSQSKHMASHLGRAHRPAPTCLGTCPGLRPGCSRGLLSPYLPQSNPG